MQVNKIRDENSDITTDISKLQSIIRENYEVIFHYIWYPKTNGQIPGQRHISKIESFRNRIPKLTNNE